MFVFKNVCITLNNCNQKDLKLYHLWLAYDTKIELQSKIYHLRCAAPCVKIVELWHTQKKSYMQIELEQRAKLLISVHCNDSYPVNCSLARGKMLISEILTSNS